MDKNIQFKLHGIEVFSFSMEKKPGGFVGKLFSFDIATEAKVHAEKGLVVILFNINVRDDQNELVLAALSMALGFEIEDFKENIVNEDKIYIIPTKLEILLRTITISTSRGILYSYLKGTYLHKAMLPIIPALLTPAEEQKTKETT